MERRIECLVIGSVSGIGYGEVIKNEADRLGINGTVEEKNNGKIKIIAEGDEDILRRFITFFFEGVDKAHVVDVDTHWYDTKAEFIGFSIVKPKDDEFSESEL